MRIILTVAWLVLVLPVVSFSMDKESTNALAYIYFCSDMLNKLDSASAHVQMSEGVSKALHENGMEENNIDEKVRTTESEVKFDKELESDIHYLADVLNIYKASGCDMTEAIKHMYCPHDYKWNKDCQWVYQEDKPKKHN